MSAGGTAAGTRAVPQLDSGLLARIEPTRPRRRPIRILQFGTGRFLLGFLGDFVDRANRETAFDGRIVALQSTGTDRAATINRQQGAYTLVTRGAQASRPVEEHRILDALQCAIVAQAHWSQVLEIARDPALSVVVSNTTEAGLALDPEDRVDSPRSYPARLAAVLLERHRASGGSAAGGLVVLPCELIERNGDELRRKILELTRAWGAGERFHRWLARECRFCNTLVDRIVTGRPTGAEQPAWQNKLGYRDDLLTIAEPYALWAIEGDEALRERLGFASANSAILVAPDISPYRELKLRVLNAAHTAVAPLGLLVGHRTMIQLMLDPMLATFVEQLLRDEIAPTLPFDRAQVHTYIDQVLARFRNPFLEHSLLDIAAQSAVKIRTRLVPVICRAASGPGHPPKLLALAFAAYLCLARRSTLNCAGSVHHSTDDALDHFMAAWDGVRGGATPAAARNAVIRILSTEQLWGANLGAHPRFVTCVAQYVHFGMSRGFRSAVAQAISSGSRWQLANPPNDA